jgi:hypothetical protein
MKKDYKTFLEDRFSSRKRRINSRKTINFSEGSWSATKHIFEMFCTHETPDASA